MLADEAGELEKALAHDGVPVTKQGKLAREGFALSNPGGGAKREGAPAAATPAKKQALGRRSPPTGVAAGTAAAGERIAHEDLKKLHEERAARERQTTVEGKLAALALTPAAAVSSAPRSTSSLKFSKVAQTHSSALSI